MTGAELRASILQAAVQGKLVPQDPNDEPACVLLERIREERRELVKQKRAKAPKGGESVITRYPDGTVWEQRGTSASVEITDEVPFDIPEGWEWARYKTVADTLAGFAFKSSEFKTAGKYRLLRGINLGVNEIRWNEAVFIDEIPRNAFAYKLMRGDVLLGLDRPWISGGLRTAIIEDADNTYLVQRVLRIRQTIAACGQWLKLLLDAGLLWSAVANSMTGISVPHISEKQVVSILVPVPPLTEQWRIVAKLDELIPLVERYDRLDRERTELNAGIEDAMRASILQAAVQGQLTEREDGDEPASELLERIREERRELVKQKKAKAPKGGESVITRYPDGTVWEQRGKGAAVEITDEVPFDIPDGWEWARLDSVLKSVIVPQRDKPTVFGGDIPWCRIEDIEGKYLSRAQDEHYVTMDTVKRMNLRIMPAGTVISACSASIGRTAITTVDCCTNQTFIGLVCSVGLYNHYLYAYLEAMKQRLKEIGSGTTIAYISQAKYKALLIPVPPVAEQRRIVAKLDELLPKTEKLGKLVS